MLTKISYVFYKKSEKSLIKKLRLMEIPSKDDNTTKREKPLFSTLAKNNIDYEAEELKIQKTIPEAEQDDLNTKTVHCVKIQNLDLI